MHRGGEGVAVEGGKDLVHPPRVLVGEHHRVGGERDHPRVPGAWLSDDGHATVGRRKPPGGRRVEHLCKRPVHTVQV